MSARYLVEIWDRTNATRQLVLEPASAVRRRVLGGEETLDLQLVLPAAESAIVRGAVVRLVREGDASDLTLWRVSRRTRSQKEDGSETYQLELDALWGDLRHGRVRQIQSDGSALFAFGLLGITPAVWLSDIILPGYDGSAIAFEAGVVEITKPIDLTFDHPTSPLEAVRMLEQVSGGEIAFRASVDGSTYSIDLLERVGQAGGGTQLRYGRNLRGLDLVEDEADVVTRLYAQGGGLLTLADAEWEITAVTGPVAARAIAFRKSPVFEDGAFVGLYVRIGADSYPIIAADVETGQITVDATGQPDVEVGARAILTTDLAGTRLSYIESPPAVATFGVRTSELPDASDVPDASNLIVNGDLADWTAGLPDHWTALGTAVITRDQTPLYGKHGANAARVVATDDGEGILSDAFAVTASDRRPYLGMMAGLTVVSGQVRLELRHSNGVTYPITQQSSSSGIGVYITPSAGPVHDEPLPAGTAQMAVLAHGAAAEWYLDVAMITPQIGSDVPAFVRDQGAWLLWDRAVDELAARSIEHREYQVSIVDLYQVDPDRFPFDHLDLGDDVQVQHPDFGEETLRIVELDEDLLHAEAIRVSVALDAMSRPAGGDDVFRPVYRPGRPSAGTGQGTTSNPAILSHAAKVDAITGNVLISASGSANTATIQIFTRLTLADAYAASPDAVMSARSGTFPAFEGTAAFLYKLVPRDSAGVAGEAVEDNYRPSGLTEIDPAFPLSNGEFLATIKRIQQQAADVIAIARGYVFSADTQKGEAGTEISAILTQPIYDPTGFIALLDTETQQLKSIAFGTDVVDSSARAINEMLKKVSAADPDDARGLRYTGGTTLEQLRPGEAGANVTEGRTSADVLTGIGKAVKEAGAEPTAGKDLSILTGRIASVLQFANGFSVEQLRPGEAGANVTESRTSADVQTGVGKAVKEAGAEPTAGKDLSVLIGRTADKMSFGTGATVESLKPGEAGANITETRTSADVQTGTGKAVKEVGADATTGKDLSVLAGRTADKLSYGTGATVEAMKPGEAGANITETRTAADTAAVNGALAITVQGNSARAGAGLNADGTLGDNKLASGNAFLTGVVGTAVIADRMFSANTFTNALFTKLMAADVGAVRKMIVQETLVAGDVIAVSLAALSAVLGEVVAGILLNTTRVNNPTAAIRLSGDAAYSIPVSATNYHDLTGISGWFMKCPYLDLPFSAGNTAKFRGDIEAENGYFRGSLKAGAVFLDGTTALGIARGVQEGPASEGVGVSFSPAFERTPILKFGPGGVSYKSSGLTGDQRQRFEARNLSASGFTPYLRIEELPGTLTPASIGFSGTDATKSGTTQAYNDVYRFAYSATVTGSHANPDELVSSVTLGFWTNDGSGWVLRQSRQHWNGNLADLTYSGETVDVAVDSMGAGSLFRITLDGTTGNGGSVTRTSVSWSEATEPNWSSATPAGVTVPWIAISGA